MKSQSVNLENLVEQLQKEKSHLVQHQAQKHEKSKEKATGLQKQVDYLQMELEKLSAKSSMTDLKRENEDLSNIISLMRSDMENIQKRVLKERHNFEVSSMVF